MISFLNFIGWNSIIINSKFMLVYLAHFFCFILIALLEYGILQSDYFWWLGVLALATNFMVVLCASRWRFSLNFFNFLISPFLFLLGGLLFFIFADNIFLQQIIIFFIAACEFVFLRRLIIHLRYPYAYKNHSLSNISRLINIISIFFFSSAFFDLYAFLKISFLLLLVLDCLVVALTFYQFFCINKIKSKDNKFFILVSSLIAIELFFLVNWLPLISPAKAMLIVSVYYFIINISKHYALGTLSRPVYLRNSFVASLIWIITLLTARWS